MHRAAVLSYAAFLAPPHLSTLSHKRQDFLKNVTWFSLQLLSETFLIVGIIQRDIVINVKTSSCKVPVTLVGF